MASARGHEWLATCVPVSDVLSQGILSSSKTCGILDCTEGSPACNRQLRISFSHFFTRQLCRQDLRIQVCLLTGYNILNEFFTPCGENITRGHPVKFRVQQYRIDARKYFFSSRVVTIWNQLPVEIFNVVTAAAFAAGLRSCNLSHYLLGSK